MNEGSVSVVGCLQLCALSCPAKQQAGLLIGQSVICQDSQPGVVRQVCIGDGLP